MQLIRTSLLLGLLAVLVLPGCDSSDPEPTLPEVAGHWTSEQFVHEDQRGTPIGDAVLEVTLEQEGAALEGSGVLHLPQARVDLPFEVDGEVRETTLQIRAIYATAQPSTVGCGIESETELKCLMGTVRFRMFKQ